MSSTPPACAQIKALLVSMKQRPIACYPVYTDIMGTEGGGLALSQLLYWWNACKGKRFYKTDTQLRKEIRVSAWKMKRIKEKLKTLPFLKIKVEGRSARTFYEIDHKALAEAIKNVAKEEETDQLGLAETDQLGLAETDQPSITEITTENKTENKKEFFEKNISIQKEEKPAESSEIEEKFLEQGLSREAIQDAYVTMERKGIDSPQYLQGILTNKLHEQRQRHEAEEKARRERLLREEKDKQRIREWTKDKDEAERAGFKPGDLMKMFEASKLTRTRSTECEQVMGITANDLLLKVYPPSSLTA